MKLYGITVHCYFPGTILTPGFDRENECKPALTAKIEGDGGTEQTPDQCAALLIQGESKVKTFAAVLDDDMLLIAGLEKGHFFVTSDWIGEFARSSCGPATPLNNIFIDQIYRLIAIVSYVLSPRFMLLAFD